MFLRPGCGPEVVRVRRLEGRHHDAKA